MRQTVASNRPSLSLAAPGSRSGTRKSTRESVQSAAASPTLPAPPPSMLSGGVKKGKVKGTKHWPNLPQMDWLSSLFQAKKKKLQEIQSIKVVKSTSAHEEVIETRDRTFEVRK